MKRPSDSFIGALVGLMVVLFAPSNMMHSEEDMLRWLIFFPGLGAIIGTVIGIFRRRNA